MIVCLALSPSLDVTYRVGSLRPGEISRPLEVRKVAGGKGLNVARSAARLGASVTAVAVLGGRTGALVADLLAGSGVALETVPVAGETRTCVSIAPADDDRLTEVYERSDPLDGVAWAAVEESVAAVGAGDWVVLSGSVPDGVAPEQVAAVLRAAAASGARIAVDTHGPALDAVLGMRPDLVKVNRAEAAEALRVSSGAALADLLHGLRQRTGGVVIVTDGVDGSTAVGPDGSVEVLPDPVRGRYPVGSGDSYTAGLVVGLSRGSALADAVRLGAACGAANAAGPGAAVWSVHDLDEARVRLSIRPAGRPS